MEDSKQSEVPLTENTETESSIPTPSKVSLVPNWRKVFLTWSFAFHSLSVLLTFIDQILPFLGMLEPTMTTQTYAVMMFMLNGLGLLSRFIKQRKLWEYPIKEESKDGIS